MNFWTNRLPAHPIHVMLVHFPMGLFPASYIFDWLAYMQQDAALAAAAVYMMAAGLIGACAASIFGAWDFVKLPADKVIFRKGIYHLLLATGGAAGYLVLFLARFTPVDGIKPANMSQLILGGIILGILMLGAYFGGDLVYRHGIGVKRADKDIS